MASEVSTTASAGPLGLGAAVWLLLVLAAVTGHAALGIIEILLLLGPLVIVPIGLTLLLAVGSALPADTVLPRLALPAAIAVGASFLVPAGPLRVSLTVPWLILVLGLAAGAGVTWVGGRRDLVATARLIAVVWLPGAAGAITMTQAGVTALGSTPELVRLTGVHLNFAGFGAALITAQLLAATRQSGSRRRSQLATAAALSTLGGAMTVAVGHLSVRVLEFVGATAMTIGVITIGVLAWNAAPRRSVARVLLRVSGLSVVGSMGFALAYSWSLTVGGDHLPYATIAIVHGSLNAFGFTLAGLLGWLALTCHHPPRRPGDSAAQHVIT